MPTLVAPDDVRAQYETSLTTVALQLLIDDAERAVIAKFGPHTGNVTELVEGGGEQIFLSQTPSAIVSVTESIEATDLVLAANDYRAWYGRVLERLATGTNGATIWGDRVSVVYTPVDETARRKRLIIDLVKLAAEYDALKSSTIGDYSSAEVDYELERNTLLGSLAPTLGVA